MNLLRKQTRHRALGLLVAAVATAAVAAPATSAHAAVTNQLLNGSAGATQINLLNGTVTSGLTAASGLSTPYTGKTSTNTTADVKVGGVAFVGAVRSSVATTAVTGGKKVTAVADVADVDLLGGLIHADAVTTTGAVSVVNGIATPTGGTRFVGLKVSGVTLPIDIPKNYTVNIANIAKVTLNYTVGTQTSDATAVQRSAGIKVTLLGDAGTTPAGSTVLVAPANASATVPAQYLGAAIGGLGYSTQVSTVVNGVASVTSGPTAAAGMPQGGTAGKDLTNSTVGVNLPNILTTGILSNTVNGSRTQAASRSTVTSKATGINLLGGLVKADAVSAKSTATIVSGGTPQKYGKSDLVNLVVGGKAIPVGVAPNTKVSLLGLVTVTINKQVRTATGITTRALEVKVTGPGLGLPVGAVIVVGSANAWVVSAG